MEFFKNILKKVFNKEVILYLIFGVLTTIINIVIYYILFNFIVLKISDNNIRISISNLIAFIFAVLFAFITNKTIVFNSKTSLKKDSIREIVSFFIARIITFIIDTLTILGLNSLFISVFFINEKMSSLLSKIISNIIVVVLNYIFSKFFIFKNSNK